jgi:hypothetical protein
VSRRLLLLLGATAALWLLVGIPARHLGGGDSALWLSGTAALICAVPMAVTLILTARLASRAPGMLPLIALGATGLRMFAVLIAALLLAVLVPIYRDQAFWLWLVVFYLATLALDVGLLLAGRPSGPVK